LDGYTFNEKFIVHVRVLLTPFIIANGLFIIPTNIGWFALIGLIVDGGIITVQ